LAHRTELSRIREQNFARFALKSNMLSEFFKSLENQQDKRDVSDDLKPNASSGIWRGCTRHKRKVIVVPQPDPKSFSHRYCGCRRIDRFALFQRERLRSRFTL
jgi:hypothetical protein